MPQWFPAKLKKVGGLLLPRKTHSDKDRQLLFLECGDQGFPQVPQLCGLSSGRRHRRSEGTGQGLRGGTGREDEDRVLWLHQSKQVGDNPRLLRWTQLLVTLRNQLLLCAFGWALYSVVPPLLVLKQHKPKERTQNQTDQLLRFFREQKVLRISSQQGTTFDVW